MSCICVNIIDHVVMRPTRPTSRENNSTNAAESDDETESQDENQTDDEHKKKRKGFWHCFTVVFRLGRKKNKVGPGDDDEGKSSGGHGPHQIPDFCIPELLLTPSTPTQARLSKGLGDLINIKIRPNARLSEEIPIQAPMLCGSSSTLRAQKSTTTVPSRTNSGISATSAKPSSSRCSDYETRRTPSSSKQFDTP